MISCTITREELLKFGSCQGGLELFDTIANSDGVIFIKEWCALHSLWFSFVYPNFFNWALNRNIIPCISFANIDLRWGDLSGANLRWADLSGADLSGVDLREAVLSGANLSGANLSEADLRWAVLRGANLRGANLREADLRWANLREADLNLCPRTPEDPQIPGWKCVNGVLISD